MLAEGDDRQDAFSTFWLEVDEMCASCLVRIAACKVKDKPNLKPSTNLKPNLTLT